MEDELLSPQFDDIEPFQVDFNNEVQEDEYNARLFSKSDNVEKGNFNVLPYPFKRASFYFPGIERGTYLNVSAETKVGKTQFSSYAFIYAPLLESYNNPKLKIKYLYIHAEESENRIKDRIVSFLLYKYTNGEIRIGYSDLNSATMPLPNRVKEVLQDDGFINLRNFFFSHIEFAEESFPTGISIATENFAKKHGTILRGESFTAIDNMTGKVSTYKKISGYKPNDPNEFLIVFMDNMNNITPERGQTLLQAITAVSKKFKDTRNQLGLTIIALQQQNADSDSNDAFKTNRIEPKVTNLADCKQVSRDINLAIGLLAPSMKFESIIKDDPNYIYRKYPVKPWGDYLRFVFFLVNRDGESAKAYPMFFDGKINVWEELPNPDSESFADDIVPFYDKIRHISQLENEDRIIKDRYKTINGLNTSFFIINKQINNILARFSLKEYLCKLFHIKFK